jgi:hypothetical protein
MGSIREDPASPIGEAPYVLRGAMLHRFRYPDVPHRNMLVATMCIFLLLVVNRPKQRYCAHFGGKISVDSFGGLQ